MNAETPPFLSAAAASAALSLTLGACATILGVQDGIYVGGGGGSGGAAGAAGQGGAVAGAGGGGAGGTGGSLPVEPHVLWAYGVGDAGEDSVGWLAVDPQDNVYAGVWFHGTVDPGNGTVTSSGGVDSLIVKLGPDGGPIWQQQFGGSGDDYVGNIILTADGKVFASIYVDAGGGTTIKDVVIDPGEGAIVVVRLDPIDGAPIHARKFLSSLDGQPLLVADGNDLILTGNVGGQFDVGLGVTASQSYDPIVVRLDANLNTIGTPLAFPVLPSFQQVYSAARGPSGALVLAGHFDTSLQPPGWSDISGVGTDIFLVTVDGNATTHAASYGGDLQESGYGVATSTDRLCLVGAYDSGGITFGGPVALPQEGRSAFVACFSPEHVYQQAVSFDGPLTHAWGVAISSEVPNRVLVAGDFQDTVTFGAIGQRTSVGSTDGFVAILNEALGVEWVGIVGGDGDDAVNQVVPTSDGFVLCGNFSPSSPEVGFGLPSIDNPKNKGLHDGFVVRYAW